MSSCSPSSTIGVAPGGGGGGGGGSSSGSSGGGGGGGGGGPCGACKFLRRKCLAGCIFAPYFDSEQGAAQFAGVHKIFGASNVSKLLLHVPVHKRAEAVVTICYEAQARLRDPVLGCVAHLAALQQQVVNLQAELSYLQSHLTTLQLSPPQPHPPPPEHPPPPLLEPPPSLTIADLPTISPSVPATYDLSSLFDPVVPHSWTTMQPPRPQPTIDSLQFGGGATRAPPPAAEASTSASGGGGSGDLEELARELLHRQGSTSATVPCNEASNLPPHSNSK